MISLERLIGACFILFLPFNDFKFFLISGSYIRPFSFYFLCLGILLSFVSVVFGLRHFHLPKINFFIFISFLTFVLFVFSLFNGEFIYQLKERTQLFSLLREFFGFSLAVAVFYYSYYLIKNVFSLKIVLSLLFLSALLPLFTGLFQSLWFFFKIDFFKNLSIIFEDYFLFRGQLGKAHGLSPEGSMLADQIVSIFIPFFLSGLICDKKNNWFISADFFFITLSFCVLFFTLSRVSIPLSFIVLLSGFYLREKNKLKFALKGLVVLVFLFLLLYFIFLFFLSDSAFVSSLIASFSNVNSIDDSIGAEAWSNVTRAALQIAGFGIFMDYPFGIGLGQYMFIYAKYLPDWASYSPEIQAMFGIYTSKYCQTISCVDIYPDPKNLFLRLLLEFGITGFLYIFYVYIKSIISLNRIFTTYVQETSSLKCKLYYRSVCFCFCSLVSFPFLSVAVSSFLWFHWWFICALTLYLIKGGNCFVSRLS